MSERISIQIPSDLRFVPKQALGSWSNEGFIERQSAHDVWKYVQETVTDQLRVGVYLAGPMGVGKSSIMYYVVYKARQLGWFVIYIPRCDSWVKAGHPSASGWYSYFFDAVLAGLQFVSDEIKKKYAYCFPPNNHASWTSARLKERLSLEYFQDLFEVFRNDILLENEVEVILAFDESQALFENGVKPLTDPPFSLVDWSDYFNRGCVFVTATADSPYRRTLRAGHERYILNVGALLDDEVNAWFQTQQFANIAKHPDYNEEFIAEIRSITGDIPRELVLLSEEYGTRRDLKLGAILNLYMDKRQAAFEGRFAEFETKYPSLIQQVLGSLVKFFIQVHVNVRDIDLRFFDTGLAYEDGGRVLPLNSNATSVFFKVLMLKEAGEWNNEVLNELKNLESDNMSQVGLAFEKLFGLNLLSSAGNGITLKYYNLANIEEQRSIQIRNFITLSADNPKRSWKDYSVGTLVAHSGAGEKRLDFIFFGGQKYVLFFEVTVSEDVSKAKYPRLNNSSRLDLILSSIGKWMGGTCRISATKELMPPRDYKGAVEYIVVSSRTKDEGKLTAGAKKIGEFPWLKIMDRNGLANFFPDIHTKKLRESMSKTK
ncbi:hypothetical protein MP638_004405 [Amoeboaphelidium occidentale]|nr:hypothetical protein MP638_004405 [Amoeboaphelidium occidentale]